MPSPGRIDYLRVPGGPGRARRLGRRTPATTVPTLLRPDDLQAVGLGADPRARRSPACAARSASTWSRASPPTSRYLRAIIEHPEFVGGDYDTGFLARAHQALLGRTTPSSPRWRCWPRRCTRTSATRRGEGAPAERRLGGGGLSPWRRDGAPRRRQGPEVTHALLRAAQGQKEPVPVEVEPLDERPLRGHPRRASATRSTRWRSTTARCRMLVDGDSYSVEFEEHGDEVTVLVREPGHPGRRGRRAAAAAARGGGRLHASRAGRSSPRPCPARW